MEMSYLGIFDWIFNKVLNHIFTPIFDFIASLLSTVLGYIFEYVLAPVLLPVLQMVWDWYTKIMMFLYGTMYYTLFSFILSMVDYLEKAFGIFIGLDPVTYYPNGPQGGVAVTGSLLEVLFNIKAVQSAFWLISFSGICIAVLLTIFGVAKSAFDLDFENKRPVSHVLKQMMKSFVGAFLVPFMVLGMIQISTIMLGTLNDAVSLGTNGERSTLGSTLFVLSSANAAWNPDYNMSTTKIAKTEQGYGFEYKDEPNDKFELLGKPRYNFYVNSTYDNYKNMAKVALYFNFGAFDFTYIIIGIALIVIMVMCLFTFIRRLFEILLLYLVSPYFVAMMPLDDGEKFKQWFGMFMGKLVTGYGSVVIMKIYLMVLPLFMKGGIEYTNLGRESTHLMYGLVALGGAWAVFKSGSLLTSLVSEAAGRHEQEAMMGAMGMMMMAASPAMDRIMSKGGGQGPGGGGGKGFAGKLSSFAKYTGIKGSGTANFPGSSAKDIMRKGKFEVKSIAKHSGQRMMENKRIRGAVNWGSRQGQKVQKAANWTKSQGNRAMDWGKQQQRQVKDWKLGQQQKAKGWASDKARQIRGTALATKMEKYGSGARLSADNLRTRVSYGANRLGTGIRQQAERSPVVQGARRFGTDTSRAAGDLRYGRLTRPTLKDFGISGEGTAAQKAGLKQFTENRNQVLQTHGSKEREKYVYNSFQAKANETGGPVRLTSKQREFYENQFRCRLTDTRYLTKDGGLRIGPAAKGSRNTESKGDKT